MAIYTNRILVSIGEAAPACAAFGDADLRGVYPGLDAAASDLRASRWPEDMVEGLCDEALAAYEGGDVLRAYEMIQQGLGADPGNDAIHFTRGVIYFREKEYRWRRKN